jgi:hypothetical protein
LLADRLLIEGKLNLNRVAVVAIAAGFAFDWIVSLSILLKTDPSMLAPFLLNGLVFDLYHAAGNLAFVAWMAVPIGEILARHRVVPAAEAVSEVVAN